MARNKSLSPHQLNWLVSCSGHEADATPLDRQDYDRMRRTALCGSGMVALQRIAPVRLRYRGRFGWGIALLPTVGRLEQTWNRGPPKKAQKL
ncbi:hypothetical protein V2G26_007791 [Clonostachys chloroleuca]